MKPRWTAYYETGEQLDSTEPQSWARLDRKREFLFDLLSPGGTVVASWRVPPEKRLLVVGRTQWSIATGGTNSYVLAGLEDRGTGIVLGTWRFDFGPTGTAVEKRMSWGLPGDADYSSWMRPNTITVDA